MKQKQALITIKITADDLTKIQNLVNQIEPIAKITDPEADVDIAIIPNFTVIPEVENEIVESDEGA